MVDVIRNCRWTYECPLLWAKLRPTDDDDVRYCESCQRRVYICHTEDELRARIEQNDCVAVMQLLPRGRFLPRVTMGVLSRPQNREGGAE